MPSDPLADTRLAGKKSLRLLLTLFAVTLGVAFFGELVIMVVMPYLLPTDAGKWIEALFDATALAAIVSAFILPLMLHYRKRNLRVARRALRLQYTLDQHAIVSITDVTGRITFANDRFCQVSGYTRQELIGQNHRMIKSDEHPPELFRDMWRTIAQGHTWKGEVCNRNKAGGLYWVHATITPFLNERGKPEEYIAIRTEITAQKALEHAKSQQEAWLRTILDNLGEGVYTLDAKGQLTYLNAEGERLIGWRFEELVGKPLHDIIHHHRPDGTRLPAAQCPIHLAMRDNHNYRSTDEVFFRKDGTALPVKMVGAPLALKDAPLGSVAVFSDVSEERLLQRRLLEAKDAAEYAMRLKSEFLSTMSHEIRTPLNGVIGMTDLLLDTPLDNEQSEFARIIKISADGLLAIINDILDFSKIEAGRLELEHTDFSLRQLIAGGVDVLTTRAREKELTLASFIAPELPDHLMGDPTRIRQILLNFLSNAIKFTAHGEVVASATLEPHASLHAQRVPVKLSVRDSGIGLTEAAIAKLFEPFSQADSSTTRKYGGTGLGLSICKRLVEAMGGEIGVDSRPGVGSTFWVRIAFEVGVGANTQSDAAMLNLSHQTPAGADRTDHEARRQQAAQYHLLLAEDNPVNQRVAVHMLNKLGYAVDVVDNGALAVAAVASADYALVLMDCQMPEMDGFAATAAIRRVEASSQRHLPIIAMTANALQGDRQKCLTAGMDDYLAKPINNTLLAAVLKRWLPEALTTAEVETATQTFDVIDSAPAAIDLKRLTDLFGDDAVIDEILTVFGQCLQPLQERLQREVCDHGDGLKRLGHELRGAASNVGALPLMELAGQLENLAQSDDWNEIEALARRIGEEIVRTRHFASQCTQRRGHESGASVMPP
jgi:PAS domain S-box-containing protein